jgi:WXG100 family type VII secretion target
MHEVDTGKLRQVASDLSELVTTFNQAVEKVYELGAQADANWDGDAGDKFVQTFQNDRVHFTTLAEIYTSFSAAITNIAAIWEENERKAREAATNGGNG